MALAFQDAAMAQFEDFVLGVVPSHLVGLGEQKSDNPAGVIHRDPGPPAAQGISAPAAFERLDLNGISRDFDRRRDGGRKHGGAVDNRSTLLLHLDQAFDQRCISSTRPIPAAAPPAGWWPLTIGIRLRAPLPIWRMPITIVVIDGVLSDWAMVPAVDARSEQRGDIGR
jgi:hypothetical protein